MNLKIKYRESFRPFAPSCLEERVGDYFELDRPSPYMLLVARCSEERCKPEDGDDRADDVLERVNQVALGRPGHHPRGLLGPRPDRVTARPTRATTT